MGHPVLPCKLLILYILPFYDLFIFAFYAFFIETQRLQPFFQLTLQPFSKNNRLLSDLEKK